MTTSAPARIEMMNGPQMDFVCSQARHPGLVAGRGSGKTYALVAKMFAFLLEHPGARGVMTQPTFDMIRRNLVPVIREQFGILEGDIKKGGIWEFRLMQQGTPGEMAFNNGSLCDLRPADDPQKFRGATYAVFGMDEIAAVTTYQLDVFVTLLPTLRQKGFPHQGFVTSTPSARRPWIQKIWRDKTSPFSESPLNAKDYPLFRLRTEDNWHLSETEQKGWMEMFGEGTRLAAQELGGEFTALEGAAFEQFNRDIHVREPPEDLVIVRTLEGLDFGAASPTSMHELCLDRANRVWVTREFYKRRADDYDWVKTAAEWDAREIYFDPSRSEKEAADLRVRYGLNLKRARSKRFDDRVRVMETRLNVREDGRPGIYFSPRCPNAINEIQGLAYAEARAGEYIVDRWQTGLNDHAFDDITYALMELEHMVLDWKPPKISEW